MPWNNGVKSSFKLEKDFWPWENKWRKPTYGSSLILLRKGEGNHQKLVEGMSYFSRRI